MSNNPCVKIRSFSHLFSGLPSFSLLGHERFQNPVKGTKMENLVKLCLLGHCFLDQCFECCLVSVRGYPEIMSLGKVERDVRS